MRIGSLIALFALWHLVFAAAQAEPAWSSQPPLHYSRAAHAVVSDGKALYALAGTGTGGVPVLVLERFDGKTWQDEGAIPGKGLNAPAAAVLDGKIYLIGGFRTDSNVPTADVLVYDIARRKWSDAAPMPAPRGGHAAVVLDGKIHVVGGGNSQSTINDHDVYDLMKNAWRALAPLPRSEGSPAAVALDGKLYAIGGRSGPNDFGSVDIYDPATNAWSEGPRIEPRGTAGAVVYCGAIHVFGGESQARHQSLGEVLRLNRNGQWQPIATMPTPRNFARAVILNDAVYVVGGSPTPEASHASMGSAIVERFRVLCDGSRSEVRADVPTASRSRS
ncbi:MAG TPA: kelch repeat-containing protein [Casimicrobiaceae bacterium]